jgi:predicted Fe-Mo cluster-binding NifX family protein
MKIAIATRRFEAVAGHIGKATDWLVYDLTEHHSTRLLPAPQRVTLKRDEIFHVFEDDRPHPLDGVDIIVGASAGDSFIRHMKKRRTEVLLTAEADPTLAITRIMAGEALPDPRFDITTSLCKVRDLFSRH